MSNKPLALVFGGSRGIGAACVQVLLRDGFDVALTYITKAPPKQSNVRTYSADVRNAPDVARVFSDLRQEAGRAPDVVIANAGINVPPGPLSQFSDESFRALVEVNIVGAFNVLREAARQVVDGGSIVAVTTSLVRNAVPGLGPYSASKAAVECLIRSMSKELAPRQVRVNAVAPGPVDTDLFRAGKTEDAKRRSAAMSPLNRVGQPEEVAETVSFLVSPKASWILGQVIQPNGGMV